jgi:hypothetical protein
MNQVEISQKRGTENEQPRLIAETHSDEMPKVVHGLRFCLLILKTKVFTQKGQTTTINPSNAKLHEETTTAEEQENRVIMIEEQGNNVPMMSSSDVPSFHISAVAPQILIVLFLIYLFDNIIQLISLRSLWYYGGW